MTSRLISCRSVWIEALIMRSVATMKGNGMKKRIKTPGEAETIGVVSSRMLRSQFLNPDLSCCSDLDF